MSSNYRIQRDSYALGLLPEQSLWKCNFCNRGSIDGSWASESPVFICLKCADSSLIHLRLDAHANRLQFYDPQTIVLAVREINQTAEIESYRWMIKFIELNEKRSWS